MEIKIIQSGKGDCLLINSGKTNILVDGGVSDAYSKYAAPELSKLQKQGVIIDMACVSHIDDDHIGGFLKMIEDLVAWRVYDYQKKNGNTKAKKPEAPRPCDIKGIWHNAFHDLVKDNAGEIENMLAASADILSASDNTILQEMGEIALSKGQAIQLSRRLKPEQLNIPLNSQFKGKFVMCRKKNNVYNFGKLTFTVIAPFKEDLDKLRDEWNKWLSESKEAVKKIRAKVDKDSGSLSNSATPELTYYKAIANEWGPELLAGLDTAAAILGRREKVTTPNLASIMFLVEEAGKTLLMTGDGHWADILKGLETNKKLDRKKGLHLDVLKVQHHGSEHNLSEDFCNIITADHYIFCGNGEHENPDLQVVRAIIDSRTTVLARTKEAKNKFTLWFNSSSTADNNAKAKAHMKKVEQLVQQLAASHSKLKYQFMPAGKNFMKLTV
jgi:beta-lactamase superfamily II metal-dependent hydrolase